MFATALLLAGLSPPTDPDFPDVCLGDARNFSAVTPAAARANWLLARGHKDQMRDLVVGWNNPSAVVRAWEAECLWRNNVWYLVDDIRYCDQTAHSRLQSLHDLKEMLGKTDFGAGRLPAPVPSTYRFPEH